MSEPQPAYPPRPPIPEAVAPESRFSFWKPLALFALTVLSTTATGALYVHQDFRLFPLWDGLVYSVPLLTILVCHEFGHYFAAKLHGVPASLPYFIPLPPGFGFGTMGAVISQAGTTDRKKLIDIGAAGPLAGLIVAIPIILYGLTLSEVKPLVGIGQQEGNSLLYLALKYLTKGAWLPSGGVDVSLHPTAWAGWAGLFVTMVNLLPIGQLDGGHVATAYFGNPYRRTARVIHQGLPWLSLLAFTWVYWVVQREALGQQLPEGLTPLKMAINGALVWMVWFFLLWGLGRLARGFDHPPVDDQVPLPPSRNALFWVVAVIFALIFMPVPLRMSVGAPPPSEPAAASEAAAP